MSNPAQPTALNLSHQPHIGEALAWKTGGEYRLYVAGVVCVTMLLRLAYAVYITHWLSLPEKSDADFYFHAAKELAERGTYPQVAHWMPLYSLLLGGSFALCGASLFVGRILNVILAGFACLLIMRWARTAFSS